MRRFSMTVAALILVLCNRITAEDWRTIAPDVIYGHKAGMALTYDVVRPAKDPNGAAILFMVSGGWVSMWAPPEYFIRPEKGSLNLFEKIVDRGYTLILVRHGSSPYFKVPDAVADVKLAIPLVSDASLLVDQHEARPVVDVIQRPCRTIIILRDRIRDAILG